MKKQTKGLICAAALGMLCMAGTAQASTAPLTIAGVGQVSVLDLSPGNAIAYGGQAAVNTGNSFPLYYQAKLGNFLDSDGNTMSSGLGSAYEITAVFGFYEKATVTGITTSGGNVGSTAAFTFDANKPSFVTLFLDTAIDSNNLLGTGFTNGTPILQGHVISKGFDSSFASINDLVSATPYKNLDSSPNGVAAQWAGIKSVSGSGGTDIAVAVDSYDSSFFIDPPVGLLQFDLLTNTSNNLPFNQIDPSVRFYTGGDVNDPLNYISSLGQLGSVNGHAAGLGGPSIMFQADANASFEPVPEPSTLVLSGLGLLLAGGYLRRRKNA